MDQGIQDQDTEWAKEGLYLRLCLPAQSCTSEVVEGGPNK